MCSMKIFHLNYCSVGDLGPLMYFGKIRVKLTINSNLEHDQAWVWSTCGMLDWDYMFPWKTFLIQNTTKLVKMHQRNTNLNHEFCEIPTNHWLPEDSPPILECLRVRGEVWEWPHTATLDIWRLAVNKAAITREEREEDLGPAVTRFMSLHVWEILALLLSIPLTRYCAL